MTFLAENGSPEGSLTFAGLHEAARKIAAGLVAKGLSGRNLMLLYAPGLDYIQAFFGCMYAGCVPVPAYPPMGARDIDRLKRVVMDCNAGAILSSSMLMPMIEAWVANPSNGLNIPCIPTDALIASQDATGFDAFDAKPSDVAFLQYTSGSTGHPKGVMVSHENLIANFQQIVWTFAHSNDLDEVGPAYKTVIWLPPFHDMGLIGGVLTPVYVGAKVTLMSPLTFLKNPFVWLKTISDMKAKVSGGPNFSYQYCARKVSEEQLQQLDLSSWQVAFNGAEPIQVDSLHTFANKFAACGFDASAFLPCYGLAEATLFVAGSPATRGAKVINAELEQLAKGKLKTVEKSGAETDSAPLVSSGVLAIETDVRIVDPKTQRQCGEGEIGEIWVNSPSVAQGYWDKPSFSESVFRASISGDDSGKMFMRTGDLGVMSDNELYVTGRIKELIIVAGRNHYPQDIEYSLQSSNPVFRKGCGAAFAVNDQGKEHLIIMQEVSNAGGGQTDYQQLALAGSRAVATRHGITPKSIVFIAPGTLPKTSSGKIQRTEAKKLYELGNFAPLHSWETASSKVVRKVTQEERPFTDWQTELYCEMQSWVSDKLNVEPHHIDLDVTFQELGVDSIEAIDLVDRLQDRIARTIPATELMRYPTVKALIEHFASELTEKELTPDHDHKEEQNSLTKNTA
jgi:acyl-CoA synthetase (AMP-forming)/AMP-acid ligase II/acyl carrier protein